MKPTIYKNGTEINDLYISFSKSEIKTINKDLPKLDGYDKDTIKYVTQMIAGGQDLSTEVAMNVVDGKWELTLVGE